MPRSGNRDVTESLSDLIGDLPDDEAVALDRVLSMLGTRAHGTAILLLSIPDAIPLPLPSAGAILGIPLALISIHLALFGDRARLPERIRRWRISAKSVTVIKRHVAPLIARAESVSRPRLAAVADRQRLVGLLCLFLSLLLLLPIPFFNTPPSLCLVLLAWGLIQRDGAIVIAGILATTALVGALTLLVGELVSLVA